MALTSRKIKIFKETGIAAVQNLFHNMSAPMPPDRKLAAEQTYAAQIEVLRRVPALPFRHVKDVAIFVTGFIADFAAVLAILIVVL